MKGLCSVEYGVWSLSSLSFSSLLVMSPSLKNSPLKYIKVLWVEDLKIPPEYQVRCSFHYTAILHTKFSYVHWSTVRKWVRRIGFLANGDT